VIDLAHHRGRVGALEVAVDNELCAAHAAAMVCCVGRGRQVKWHGRIFPPSLGRPGVTSWTARTGPPKIEACSRGSRQMSYVKDPRVDAYLDALPVWQREIFSQVRELVHVADPDVEETIKRSVQPYFVLEGNICAFLAAKDHVNVFVYDGAIVPDPEGIITAGHDNRSARTVGFRPGETVNERALLAMFKQIIANNRVGGWRKLKGSS
jgi:hypothetical protein